MEAKNEKDTVALLQECGSGVRMGTESIRQVEDRIHSAPMRQQLIACRKKHERLGHRTDELLQKYGAQPQEPSAMLRGMAWLKTNVKMMTEFSDAAAADVLTDGCNMGVKSLTKYLNEYPDAAPEARAITKELIALEEQTTRELQPYL